MVYCLLIVAKVPLLLLLSQKDLDRGQWWNMWPWRKEELREAFEAVAQEKETDASTGDKKKGKDVEEEVRP